MIPKLIHYIWVGPNPLPDKNRELIAKSQRHLSGYTVRIWREADLDMTPAFVRRAYAAGQWAFVSDYLRFVILRDQGGIYLDTDMEVLRPLDDLLSAAAFAGYDRTNQHIYCGIIGAVPQHPLFAQLVRDYDALPPGRLPTSPEMLTSAYKKSCTDLVLHPADTFYPCSEGEQPDPARMAKAYATHHWDESWRRWVGLRRLLRRLGILKLLHLILKKTGLMPLYQRVLGHR
mgnify:CR=1 FL=1